MSYSTQEYNSNNAGLVDQQFENSLVNANNDNDIFQSFFGLANRMMSGALRNGGGIGGISSFSSSDSNNPNVKVFGVSSMNVTQISRGRDGRPHIVQAQDERRMGPGGIWQTKKALRDPDRGIDQMQVGYFVGNQGEIVERRRDPTTGQYRQEIKRRGAPSNEQNFTNQWRTQAQQAMQRPPPLPSNHQQYSQQILPPPSNYNQQKPSYEQYPQQSISYDQYSQQAGPTSNSYQYY